MEKSDKKCSNNYNQTIRTSSYHEGNTSKVSKRSVQNCKEELRSQEVPTVYILRVKNDYVHNKEKVTKNNLTIIPKSHAHPHTMKKIQAKFQNDRYKSVRGAALRRHPGKCLRMDGWTDGTKADKKTKGDELQQKYELTTEVRAYNRSTTLERSAVKVLKGGPSSQKHTYIILTPLNPTFI